MFRKKKAELASVATVLGTFVWDSSYENWSCEVVQGTGKLVLSYDGNPLQVARIAKFQQILADLAVLSPVALETTARDIEDHDHSKDEMELIGVTIDPSDDEEAFSLDFGFSKWPDGGLTVHFRGREVVASHIDD